MRTVYLALGSNVGDRLKNLRTALAFLLRDGRVTAVSALYETVPAGVLDQPPFLNAACSLDTALPLTELLAAVKQIEWELGRRPGPIWGPRPIDVDLLLAGDETVDTPALTVPHPRIAERGFVLAPLADVAPAAVHPLLGLTVARLLEALPASEMVGVRRIAGPGWASGSADAEEPFGSRSAKGVPQ